MKQKIQDLDKMAKAVSWHKDPATEVAVPSHIKAAVAQRQADAAAIVKTGECGHRVAASELGLKKKALALFATNHSGPEHAGRNSFAKPGVGNEQTLADNGRDAMGVVGGDEVYTKVLKDGYFEVGCYFDAMLESGDKYGDDKDKYGSSAKMAEVSVAKYKELVLEDKQVAMTPTVCFQFCRTIQGMVFFGIANGNECYCEPYYKPQPGDDSNCDVGCEGDPTVMCGNAKSKSTVWEMHLCDSTAEDLETALTGAEEALEYFFEVSALAADLGVKMTEAGDALEDVGGLSGSPSTGDHGMAAKVAGGTLSKAYTTGRKSYETLLDAASKAKGLNGADFSVPSKITEAEYAMKVIKEEEGNVLDSAAAIHKLVKAAYPAVDYKVLGDEPAKGDAIAEQLAKGVEAGDFRLASYFFGARSEVQASSCAGTVIGVPMIGLGENGCGVACEATVYPRPCQAYALYEVEGKDNLCFLFEAVKDVETFTEPASFAQTGLRKKAGANTFGTCMVKLSSNYKPEGPFKKLDRCLGGCGAVTPSQDVATFALPGGSDVKQNGKTVLTKLA